MMRPRAGSSLRKRSNLGSLHAMVGPQHPLAIGEIDGLKGLLPEWVVANETWPAVCLVLRHHDIRKTFGDAIDDGNDFRRL